MEPSETPTTPLVSNPQPVVETHDKETKARKPWLLWLLIVILVAGAGFLGYEYKTAHDQLNTTQTKLATTQASLAEAQNADAANAFIAKYNDATQSNRLCSGHALGMFNVHINDKFAVFRYLCANQSAPVLIGALKKLSDGSYEFTYGSSTVKPNNLPSYIYDTEPNFFGPVYGATRY